MKVPALFRTRKTTSTRGKSPATKTKPRKLKAAARSASRSAVDDYEDEPTMKLGTAVIVVLVLHIVAVGGVYAFNRIKAERVRNTVIATELAEEAPTTLSALSKPETVKRPIDANAHQVESGETLVSIARTYGVTVAALEDANDLNENSVLRIGQELRIPAKAAPAPAPRTEVVRAASTSKPEPAAPPASHAGPEYSGDDYVVVAGDNPVAIARKFGVSYNDLIKLNGIDDPRRLQIGQKLKIPTKH